MCLASHTSRTRAVWNSENRIPNGSMMGNVRGAHAPRHRDGNDLLYWGNNTSDWSVPIDLELIADAFENDDFWLPVSDDDAIEGDDAAGTQIFRDITTKDTRGSCTGRVYSLTGETASWLQTTLVMSTQNTTDEGIGTLTHGLPLVAPVQLQHRPRDRHPVDLMSVSQSADLSIQPSICEAPPHRQDAAGMTENFDAYEDAPTFHGATLPLQTVSRPGSHAPHPVHEARIEPSLESQTSASSNTATSWYPLQPAQPSLAKINRSLGSTRPLTAYNFFFRFERARVLSNLCRDDDTANLDTALLDDDPYKEILQNPRKFQEQALMDQWSRDPSVKRKHCKSHGRISFQALTRHIAQRWRTMPETAKHIFREISARDVERHSQETKCRSSSKQQRQSGVAF